MSLDRFVSAQDGVYPTALSEITAGRKESHWMWFIWPQVRSLGRSQRALHYGLNGLEEAKAYLAHPILGPRLVEISKAMLAHQDIPSEDILGPVDALKLRSCATLFRAVPGADPVFDALLGAFYGGTPVPRPNGSLPLRPRRNPAPAFRSWAGPGRPA